MQCASSDDCNGGSCVTDGKNGVCQTPEEKNAPCQNQSQCPSPLACAGDYRCRNLCFSDVDCNVLGVTGRFCATDSQGVQYCADPPEVSDAGRTLVTTPPPSAPEEPVVEPVFDAGPLEAGTTVAIGTSGGTFGLGDLTVTVPPGALDHTVQLSITPMASPPSGEVGQAYEIGPTGTLFRQPVLITITYTDSELGGRDPSAFFVSTVVGNAWQPISQPIVDPYTKTISGTTSHLSPYALATPGIVEAGVDGEAGPGLGFGLPDGGPACAPLPTGIVGWWAGEGNTANMAGNAATGNGQFGYGAGKVGQAFSFNNSTMPLRGTVQAPVASQLANAWTVEAWVRYQAPQGQQTQEVFMTFGQVALMVQQGYIGLTIAGGQPVGNGNAAANTWHHVAVSYSQNQVTLFVNGAQAGNTNAAGLTINGIVLGGDLGSPQPTGLFGGVDEVSVYSRALTPAEILAIYNAQGLGKCTK